MYKLPGSSCRSGSHGRLSLTQCAGCRHGLPVQSAGRYSLPGDGTVSTQPPGRKTGFRTRRKRRKKA